MFSHPVLAFVAVTALMLASTTPAGAFNRNRCGTHATEDDERIVANVHALEELRLRVSPRAADSIVIPVWMHIDTGLSTSPTDAQIDDQMEVLNNAFPSPFSFVLAGVDRRDWPIHFDCEDTITYSPHLAHDPAIFLNVYVCLGGTELLGRATFPWWYPEHSLMHGVIVDGGSFPGGSRSNYNLGATLVHEVGHYVGLFHTFRKNGTCEQNGGDGVSDTPTQQYATEGCPSAAHSCNSPDPIHNYMDYSDDACLTEFTEGQRQRAIALTAEYRPRLVSLNNCNTRPKCEDPRACCMDSFAGISQQVGSGAFGIARVRQAWYGEISLHELRQHHPGCNRLVESQTPECVSAVHHACDKRVAKSIGFAQEVGRGGFEVACVTPTWYDDVALPVLTALHGGCNHISQSQTAHCVDAIHTFCRRTSRGDGGIAQEVGQGVFGVACFRSETYEDLPLSTAQGFNEGCNALHKSREPDCVAAFHRFASQAYHQCESCGSVRSSGGQALTPPMTDHVDL